MATEKTLIDQIKSLSELEFAALFEEIKEHADKRGWAHFKMNHYDQSYYRKRKVIRIQ